MSNPNKRWSWGGALGRSTGPTVSGAASGALAGALGGPLGIPAGAAVGGAIGFVGGFIGAALGHWWDEVKRKAESFGSGALFTLVISGILDIPFVLLAISHFSSENKIRVLTLLIGFSSIISSAAKSLIDDLHATYSSRIDSDPNAGRTRTVGGAEDTSGSLTT